MKKNKNFITSDKGWGRTVGATALAASFVCFSGFSQAYQFETGPDWSLYLDTTLQHTIGMRVESRDGRIANNPSNHQSDFLFDQGDLVTNRLQALFELTGTYQNRHGFRVSASKWKDWAYDRDGVEANPDLPDSFNVYPTGTFSKRTDKFHIEGDELLDAFVFSNFDVGDKNATVKVGRTSQQWGNAFFFGYSNIAYSQQPTDSIKAFSQPGSSVKELFLPRNQVLASLALTPELSITGQYYLEFEPNRFPEGGTYLAPADILFEGPETGGAVTDINGDSIAAGRTFEPDDLNDNFGVKLAWYPRWARGEMAFYYRQFDEVQPYTQLELFQGGGGNIHLSYPEKTELFGVSYETAFRSLSMGFEASYRKDTALATAFFSGGLGEFRAEDGARGDIYNVIVNGLLPMGSTPLWDTSTLIAEVSYTHLDRVTENEEVYLGEGFDSCVDTLDPTRAGGVRDGCGSKNAVALALQFTPAWLQPLPSLNLSMPTFVQWGVDGNPAYNGGSFFAENSVLWSVGIRADYKASHTFSLTYQDYYFEPIETEVDNGFGDEIYPGGNGAFALNDKGWISLQYQTSF